MGISEEITGRFDVRPLSGENVPDAVLLSAEAGWNQNENDWRLMTRLGEATGVWTTRGRLVATALTLPYGGLFGWISMVLVTRDFRHQGLATALLGRCTESLREQNLTPGLDATEDGRPVYLPLGFHDIYGLTRLTAEKIGALGETPPAPGIEIRGVGTDDLEALTGFDQPFFGGDRSEILRDLHQRQPARAFLAEKRGRIAGYVLGREGREADQVGPLVAESPQIAVALAHSALNHLALANLPRRVYLDVADHHPALVDWLTGIGLTRQRGYTRMLQGASRPFDNPEKIFVIAGPELG